MTTIAHASITNANLHECKGISAATVRQLQVADGAGSGTWRTFITWISAVLSPPEVSANTTEGNALSVPGVVAATDIVLAVKKPGHQAGLIIGNAIVTDDDEVTVIFGNCTASPITPTASETYVFVILRTF